MVPIEAEDQDYLRQIAHLVHNAGRDADEAHGQTSPSLPVAEDLCHRCTAPKKPTYPTCYACGHAYNQATQWLRADSEIFLMFAIAGEQSGKIAHSYKGNEGHPQSAGSLDRMKLLAYFFVKYHSACLGKHLGQGITSVCTVPSGKGRSSHPLETDILQYFTPPLEHVGVRRTSDPHHASSRDKGISPDRYAVDADVSGRHALIVEDTWVSGTQVRSVAAALKKAGASNVSVLCLARFLNPSYSETCTWLERTRDFLPPYDPAFCPVTRSMSCP
ncbi:hypothetical protein GCM10020260_00210 [Nesterenkonia halobia]|uniref:Phosphoribosyltransferase domain-containing protein n=1 Tax=Nesterenkonia halobia TaxID=37922 RepID=A0ABP6R757_9MICC